MSKKSEEKKIDFEILVVHFVNPIMIGKALDVRSNLSQKQIVLGECIDISMWNDSFLRLDFTSASGGFQAYSEIIPIQQVAKLIFKD